MTLVRFGSGLGKVIECKIWRGGKKRVFSVYTVSHSDQTFFLLTCCVCKKIHFRMLKRYFGGLRSAPASNSRTVAANRGKGLVIKEHSVSLLISFMTIREGKQLMWSV